MQWVRPRVWFRSDAGERDNEAVLLCVPPAPLLLAELHRRTYARRAHAVNA